MRWQWWLLSSLSWCDNVFNGLIDKTKKIDDDWLEYKKDYMKSKNKNKTTINVNKNVNENENENVNDKCHWEWECHCHCHLSFSFTLTFSLTVTLFFVFCLFFLHNIKMIHYSFNRQEILQKAKERYSMLLSFISKIKKL